ncbi:hypothetical protein EG68_07267 [Paragonimus skrjabini miyazakii]|uniref:Uncharacterized protein n=1 Tax=Paragonimus skrjabini miyazakii TaxID=59628 RepID=A0A8S9YSR4_9TREM|nr:hypothetical protein EG68_07267 [Paragonimus skrjabini miyazakii]
MTTDIETPLSFHFTEKYSEPLTNSNLRLSVASQKLRTGHKNPTISQYHLSELVTNQCCETGTGVDENLPVSNDLTVELLTINGGVQSKSTSLATEFDRFASGLCTSVDSQRSIDECQCNEETVTISVHETYQLGYCDPTSGSTDCGNLYVFDFVDGIEVSYPVSVTNSDALPLDLPPLFIEPDYVDQLTSLATSALTQLAQLLNNWFLSCQSADEQLFVWRHMQAHEEATELRKKAIKFLASLVPALGSRWDFQSPRVDTLLTQLTSALNVDTFGKRTDARQTDKLVPVVSLCSDPYHCLNALRNQIVALLQKLLPQLELPQSFDSSRDLQPLLATLCEVNKRSVT